MGNYLQSGTIDIKMRILPLKLRKMHILKNFIKSCRLRKENFPLKYNRNRPERQKTINDKVRSIIGKNMSIILLTLSFILLIMQKMHIFKNFKKTAACGRRIAPFCQAAALYITSHMIVFISAALTGSDTPLRQIPGTR